MSWLHALLHVCVRVQPANVVKGGEQTSDAEGSVVANVEGQQYIDAKTYLMVEIELQTPLVPKRHMEQLSLKWGANDVGDVGTRQSGAPWRGG